MSALRTLVRSALLLFPAVVLTQGCAPLFSDARLVGRGQTEITASLTPTGTADMGENRYFLNDVRIQAMHGTTDRLDLGVGYSRLQMKDGGTGAHAIGFGPKVSIVPDRFAIATRVGFLFGDEVPVSESWHMDPTLLFTLPMTNRIDFNPSVRFLIPFCESCEMLVGVNAGFGISAGNRRVILRPEVGVLFTPRESGIVWTVGLGVSVRPAGW